MERKFTEILLKINTHGGLFDDFCQLFLLCDVEIDWTFFSSMWQMYGEWRQINKLYELYWELRLIDKTGSI